MRTSTDITEIEQLIPDERQGRDRGWWDQLRSAYPADSFLNLSWFKRKAERSA